MKYRIIEPEEVRVLKGSVIRELRIKKGLTQEELGEAVGMTQSQISLIEKHGTDRISIVKVFGEVFGLSVVEMLRLAEGKH